MAPNRIPDQVHWLRGTWRRDRHDLPTSPPAPDWTPTAAQLGALEPAGRAWLDRFLAEQVVSSIEGEVILTLALIEDRLAEIHQARLTADLTLRLKLDRLEQNWLRQRATLLLALKGSR
jgi:hypothetical protein